MVTCLLIYFCCPWLSTVGTSRHPGSSPSSSLLLQPGSAAEVALEAAVTRPQLGTDAGQGCSSSPRLEAGPGRSPRPGVGHAALRELQRRGPSSPRRLPRSLAWGQWLCHPSRSGALLVKAAALEGEPAPAASPRCSRRWAGLGEPRSLLIPGPAGLESLSRWGERGSSWETKPCLHRTALGLLLAQGPWHRGTREGTSSAVQGWAPASGSSPARQVLGMPEQPASSSHSDPGAACSSPSPFQPSG